MSEDRQRLLEEDLDESPDAGAGIDHRVAIAFLVLGAGMLWPFNSFITASEFFSRIFHNNEVLLKYYSSSITFLFTVTNLASTVYCTLTVRNANLDFRVRLSTAITCVTFTGLAVLTAIKLRDTIYFILLMIIVAGTGTMTGILQNGVFGSIGGYDPRYVQYVMIGQAVAGSAPAILSIVVAVVSAHPEESASGRAFAYFLSSSVVLGAAYMAHGYLRRQGTAAEQKSAVDVTRYSGFLRDLLPWTIFIVFAVTLAIFPSVTASVRSVVVDDGLGVPQFRQPQVFIPIGFLVWNLGDLLARILCTFPWLTIERPTVLFAASLIRVVFIPGIYLCNVKGNGAVIQSDLFFLAYMLLFGLTNGYVASLTMATAISRAPVESKKDVGAFMSFMLCSGLVVGSLISFAF